MKKCNCGTDVIPLQTVLEVIEEELGNFSENAGPIDDVERRQSSLLSVVLFAGILSGRFAELAGEDG